MMQLLEDPPEVPTPGAANEYYAKIGFCVFLVLIGGVFSGLTLGLMGLDMVNLQVLSSSGSEREQKDALEVLRLLEKGRHWVLVCLLLSNVIVNESLPIFLHSVLGGGLSAVVASTALIVVFGEIVPQAVCARHGLRIGAKCAPFVLALMYAEFPVAWPIAKLLDWLLGESHGTVYKKAELKTFVGLHRHIGDETLNEDEVTIISAVLELSDKPVSLIMTPIEDTYTLPSDALLNQRRVDEILALGHSRIPIHAPDNAKNFIGMLIVKKLISYDPSQAQPISTFPLSVLPETGPDSTCLDALNYFQQGRSHILLVSTTPGRDGGAIGVVSLEDVIEEMIGEEIVDETDLYVDLHNKIKVYRGAAKRVATTQALAPLIQGVIERRRFRDSDPSPAPSLKSKSRPKIGLTERRNNGLLARTQSNFEGGADYSRDASRDASPARMSRVVSNQSDAGDAESQSDQNEEPISRESTPLLKKEDRQEHNG